MSDFEVKIPVKPIKNKKIAILLPYFNEDIGLKLFEETKKHLLKNGVKKENVILIRIPGALELPFTALQTANSKKYACIIALGVVIKGKTDHYEYVCKSAYDGLMKIQLEKNIPIVNGILTVQTKKLAEERIKKGKDYALTALYLI